MQNTEQQRLFEIFDKSQRILIALPAHPNGDTLGGSLALAAFLKKLNKEVEIYCEKAEFGNLSFLPNLNLIKQETTFPKSFVISVRTDKAKLEELSYNTTPEKVNIYLKPRGGNFSESDIGFGSEAAGFDLIICVDTPALESLGALYEKNAEMFFNTAKVNIDNHINNNNYANINIIDVTASSTSEIIFQILKNYEASLIDKNIATNLLTGIISKTNSFQHNKTTPKSFANASELINFGAEQQEIIRNLFKTKPLSVLKLWGRAMARIKALPEYSAMFSVVSVQDLEKSGATEQDIFVVAEDLAASVSDAKILAFAVERTTGVDLYLSANPNIKLIELVNHFGGSLIADQFAKTHIKDKQITEVEELFVTALQDLKPRLGL